MILLALGVLGILMGGAAAVVFRRRPALADQAFRLLILAGTLAIAGVALQVLGRSPAVYAFHPALPGDGGQLWLVAIDRLSAWFLLLLAVVGGLAGTFGVSYLAAERAHHSPAGAHAAFALLLAGMTGVFVAQSALLFLIVWEVMALSAYLLIVHDHRQPDVRRAGFLYLVLTHIGTAALILMFLLWGRAAGALTFPAFHAAGTALSAGTTASLLLLALVGFGIKAGMVPFHFWLPGAHASAPSHGSALLSGVMLKAGIYGLFRVLLLIESPPAWWGWLILALGLTSAVSGVLWALGQRDLKRLLAFSSVENVGIILTGLGLTALGIAYHRPAVALLGATAALLHTLNHALFKSLLFLGAGSVIHATGTRVLDRLGGLARSMPRTAIGVFIAGVAITGLPPLNGFLGEWTLLLGLLGAAGTTGPLTFAGLGTAVLALVGGLALALVVRLLGSLFVGQARSSQTPAAHDPGPGMVAPIWLLAGACGAIGIFPGPVLRTVIRLAGGVVGWEAPTPALADLGLAGTPFALSVLAFAILGLGAVFWLLRGWRLRAESVRRGSTWGCGYSHPSPRMQYTATSFSAPLLRAFALGPSRRVGATSGGEPGEIPNDWVLERVARPVWRRTEAMAQSIRRFQQGRVTTYLQYIVWTLLALLGFLVFAGGGGR